MDGTMADDRDPLRLYIPKPGAHVLGLLFRNNGLLWGVVTSCFGLLGFPGTYQNPRNSGAIVDMGKQH